MKKSDWLERIKSVEEGIKTSKENKESAEKHIEEGEVVLAAFKAYL